LQENIYRNFGMPQPNGYRKALRFMRHADKFGFPIVTFVDTPGAYAGKAAEELGQVGGALLLGWAGLGCWLGGCVDDMLPCAADGWVSCPARQLGV
jgi:hypothetical protein